MTQATTSVDPHIVEHHRHFTLCMSHWLLSIYVLTIFQLQLLIALSPSTNTAHIFTLTCLLAAWLHLIVGLSREATSRTLKFIDLIIDYAIRSPSHYSVPHDVRTAMASISVEPKIIRYICCPKCFHCYSFDGLPQQCNWRETAKSKRCGEQLWTVRSTQTGPTIIPWRLYTLQCLKSWLEYFLS